MLAAAFGLLHGDECSVPGELSDCTEDKIRQVSFLGPQSLPADIPAEVCLGDGLAVDAVDVGFAGEELGGSVGRILGNVLPEQRAATFAADDELAASVGGQHTAALSSAEPAGHYHPPASPSSVSIIGYICWTCYHMACRTATCCAG